MDTAEVNWARFREDYELGVRPVGEIAAEAGVTRQKFQLLAKRAGWRMRTVAGKAQGTRETIRRLKALLQSRLAELEANIQALGVEASAASNERDIRAMNTLVRTLEKVLELERKDRLQRARKRKSGKQFDDTERDALAARLEALHGEWTGAAAEPVAEPAASPGGDP